MKSDGMITAYQLHYFSYSKNKKVLYFILAQSHLRGFYLVLVYSVTVPAFLPVNQMAGKCVVFLSALQSSRASMSDIFGKYNCLESCSFTPQSGQYAKYVERLVLYDICCQKTLVSRILGTCSLTFLTRNGSAYSKSLL